MKRAAAALALALASAAGLAGTAAATPGFFVGVAEDDAPSLVRAVAPAADLGMTAFRVPVYWRPGRTSLDPAQAQSLERLIVASGPSARIVTVVTGAPANAPHDAARRDEFCLFARSVTTRYAALRDIVVWNEPNKTSFWQPQFHADGSSSSPAAYQALLARCWDVLHEARRNVNVVAPALSPTGNDNPRAVSNISHTPVTFIQRLGEAYRASGRTRRLFDTVAHHVYGSTPAERPWRRHAGGQVSQGDLDKFRGALASAFGGTGQALPGQCDPGGCVWIWYTEAGFQTTPDAHKQHLYHGTENILLTLPDEAGGEPEAPPPDPLSRAPDHATQLVDAVRLAYCQPYVQGFVNYLMADNPNLERWQSGLLWADWTRKDSYAAARAVIAEAREGRVDCASLKGGPLSRSDVAAPGRPSGPAVMPGPRRVAVSWRDASDPDVMAYHVFRAPTPRGPFKRVTTRAIDAGPYVDRGLRNGRTYHYAVSLVDTSANESALSAAVCATPTPMRAAYPAAGLAVGPGSAVGPRAVGLLHRDDGSRLAVASARRGARHVAGLVVRFRLPPCATRPQSLALTLEAGANGLAEAAVAVRDPRRGLWVAVGAPWRLAHSDRTLRWTLRAARWLSPGGELRFRLRSRRPAPFVARVDLMRVTARH